MRIRHFAASLAVLLLSMPAVAEQESAAVRRKGGAPGPVEMVRTLQLLQDQIVSGSTVAHVSQRVLLMQIEDRLMACDPTIWQEQRNIYAAVTFVLSGGPPTILKKLLALDFVGGQDRLLIEGALAYIEGREQEAEQHLNDIDPHVLPPGLAGQVALVQSALVVRHDPAKSIRLLDFVRLQMPGTLVEEAALRREIFVVSQTGDTKKFESLSRQYLHRFQHSVYAGNFRQRFASGLTRLNFATDSNQFSRLVTMLEELEPEARLELYLLIARAAIDQGQTETAIQASEKAQELSPTDSISAARAKLYRAAAIIVTPDGFGSGLGELKRIDRTILPAKDTSLLDAALSLAGQIRDVPADEAVDAASQKPMVSPEEVMRNDAMLPSISRAQDVIGQVDQLVRRNTR